MNKRDIIKKDWIALLGEKEYFNLNTFPDEDGWVHFNYLDSIQPEKLILLEDGRHGKVRPKTLHNIENNEGWTKIESKKDLPKIEGNYICGKVDSFGKFNELQNKLSKDMVLYNFAYGIITHYKLYNSKPPKY